MGVLTPFRLVEVARDTFDRANGAIGAPWAAIGGGANITVPGISGNEVLFDNDPMGALWDRSPWSAGQWTEVTLGSALITVNGNDGVGPIVRGSLSQDDGYWVEVNTVAGSRIRLHRIDDFTYTIMRTFTTGPVPAVGDRILLAAFADTLVVMHNEVEVIVHQDGTHATGLGGFHGTNDPPNSQNPTIASWRGGILLPAALAARHAPQQRLAGVFA